MELWYVSVGHSIRYGAYVGEEVLSKIVCLQRSQCYQCHLAKLNNRQRVEEGGVDNSYHNRITAGACSAHRHYHLPWVELNAGSRDLPLAASACEERVMRVCNDTVLFLLPYPVGCGGQPWGFACSQNVARKASECCGSGRAQVYRNGGGYTCK